MSTEFGINFGHIKLGNCRYGWMFYGGPYIGKCFELYGEYSESEVSVFKAFIQPGAFVVEVGANIGSLTVPMAKLAGEEGRVIAFESHLETFKILNANLAINQLKNTKAINAFVAKDTTANTSSPVWGEFAFVSDIWSTDFTTIDALELPRLDFIKVDVDGNELTVLQSGQAHIAKYKPIIYFENDLRDESIPLLKWVMEQGYRIFFHPAPIWSPENFYNNPENHWKPNSINSLMMLAIPEGQSVPDNLREVKEPTDWWDGINFG